MKKDIIFMPLGGGQSVGASCYYLKLGESNLILDAGIGTRDGMSYEPDIFSLITSPYMESLNQLEQVYISHAHMDHVGYLLNLMKSASNASVYMTELTALLAQYQLYDKNYAGEKECEEEKRLAAQQILDHIVKVGFMQTMDFGKYKVTFLPAGHIPGAMMLLIEFGKKKILYTGDYSLEETVLTSSCVIPENLKVDILIMCGLHAKHSDYVKKSNHLFKTVSHVMYTVTKKKKSVLCQVSQLSKGIEFLKTLNEHNKAHVPIYIDSGIMRVVEKMERAGIPILTQYNKQVTDELPEEPHIFISSEKILASEKILSSKKSFGFPKKSDGAYRYHVVKADFSLHEDFEDMKHFIKKINPQKAVIVHCAKERDVFEKTIEQELMHDGECRTQFIFAEDGESYIL